MFDPYTIDVVFRGRCQHIIVMLSRMTYSSGLFSRYVCVCTQTRSVVVTFKRHRIVISNTYNFDYCLSFIHLFNKKSAVAISIALREPTIKDN